MFFAVSRKNKAGVRKNAKKLVRHLTFFGQMVKYI